MLLCFVRPGCGSVLPSSPISLQPSSATQRDAHLQGSPQWGLWVPRDTLALISYAKEREEKQDWKLFMSQRGAQHGFTFTRPGGSNQPRTLLTHSGVSVIAPSAGASSQLHCRTPRVTQTHAVVEHSKLGKGWSPHLIS